MKCNKAGVKNWGYCCKRSTENISQKGGRLKKKDRKEFFVVEGILDNGNIELKSWKKNEIEHKTVPPQHLKKFYLDELKMEDLHKSFNEKYSEVESEEEQEKNFTNSLKIYMTHTLTSTQSNEDNLTANETWNMPIEGVSLTTNPTLIMT